MPDLNILKTSLLEGRFVYSHVLSSRKYAVTKGVRAKLVKVRDFRLMLTTHECGPGSNIIIQFMCTQGMVESD